MKMMRLIMGIRSSYSIEPETDKADYMAISATKIQHYRKLASWHRWDEEALIRAQRWAGHIARITVRAPARLVGKALQYRGSGYLKRMTELYGYQGHPQRFHVWRWELLFARRLGPEWQQYARRGEVWEDMEAGWLLDTGITFNTNNAD